MITIRSRIPTLLASLCLAGAALAQTALPTAEGEVRRVDTRAKTVTLKHGDIQNLDMPPMTMVFSVRDKAWLEGVKAGDKVRFQAVHENGQYIVTHIEPAK